MFCYVLNKVVDETDFSPKKPVADTFSGFKYNVYSVCLNPLVICTIKFSKHNNITIECSQNKLGEWAAEFRYTLWMEVDSFGSSATPVTYPGYLGRVYSTKEKAAIDALERLKAHISQKMENPTPVKERHYKQIITAIDEEIKRLKPQPKQASLFDYTEEVLTF